VSEQHKQCDMVARLEALLQRWYQDAEKPSTGTDYDTGQYDAIMLCISELRAAIMGYGAGQ